MKTFYKSIVIMAIVMGGVVMANYRGDCDSPKYARYVSEDSAINITMDYLADWRYRESRGSYGSYAQVQFIAPKEENLGPNISVTIENKENENAQFETSEAKADDLVEKRMYFKNSKLVSRTKREIQNVSAVDITLTYTMMDKLLELDAKAVPIKECAIIFEKNDKFYTLKYSSPEKDFPVFEEVFQYCISTLEIKE